MRGNITIDRQVLVSSQALPKGMHLANSNITTKPVGLQHLKRGYYTQPEQVLDFVLKRSLVKGELLSPQLLAPPVLVKKGDTVTIIAGRSDRLEVRVSGLALQDGRLNQQIRVKNTSSNKEIKVRVVGRALVRAGY